MLMAPLEDFKDDSVDLACWLGALIILGTICHSPFEAAHVHAWRSQKQLKVQSLNLPVFSSWLAKYYQGHNNSIAVAIEKQESRTRRFNWQVSKHVREKQSSVPALEIKPQSGDTKHAEKLMLPHGTILCLLPLPMIWDVG